MSIAENALHTGEFFVEGEPVPQPRPKAVKAGAFTRIVSNHGPVEAWKKTVTLAAIMAGVEVHDVDLSVRLAFTITPPASLLKKDGTLTKSARRRPSGARDGDADNLAKAVLDALNGELYPDDSQIVYLSIVKAWALKGRRPGVLVRYHPYTDIP